MLKIRLQRIGKKKQAFFRIVVMEHTKKPGGKYQELLGTYNPHNKEINVDQERVQFYLNNGAQMSATVNNLLVEQGIVKGDKVTSWKPKKKPEKPEEKPPENAEKPTEPAEKEEEAEKPENSDEKPEEKPGE